MRGPHTRPLERFLRLGEAEGARVRLLLPWLLALAVLEALGRWSSTDALEGLGVLGLLALAVVLRHQHGPAVAGWLRGTLGPRLASLGAPLRVRYGLDLRGTPALPAGQPQGWTLMACGVVAGAGVLLATAEHWPGTAREGLRGVSGLAWIVALGILWSALLRGCVLAVTTLLAGVREALAGAPLVQRNLAAWGLFCAGVLGLVLPVRVCVAVLLTIALVTALADLVLAPPRRHVWRLASDPPGRLRWASCRLWSAAGSVVAGALACGLVVLACGDSWSGMGSTATPLTGLLGLVFAKLAATSAAVLGSLHVLDLALGRLLDPARPRTDVVAVHGAGLGQRRRVRRALGQAGLGVSFGRARRERRAELRLDPAAPPFAFEVQRPWPATLRPEDLGDPRVHELLRRRAVVQHRRSLNHGLARLVREAAGRARTGGGTWLAPHLWFIPGLVRDEDELGAGAGLTPYWRVLPRRARAYLHSVLADLELDLIYVEDGVGLRRLRRVLALLHETHARHGAVAFHPDRLSVNLPGLRLAVHELGLGQGEDVDEHGLGRARVLHVARDEGGGGEPASPQPWLDSMPEPELVG